MSFKYITKPVTVEAVSSDVLGAMRTGATTVMIPNWLITAIAKGVIHQHPTDGDNYCNTKNGTVCINKEDMLIKLADGEIYPCALEVFNNKYAAIE